jgi:hypothetical protein
MRGVRSASKEVLAGAAVSPIRAQRNQRDGPMNTPVERKAAYRRLCAAEPGLPLFSRDWWLDAVCGDRWQVCLVERGGRVEAALPYALRRRFGYAWLTMPPLTHTLGPWLRPGQGKYAAELSRQKDLMLELINQLPVPLYFQQSFHPSITNGLPWHWCGFQQSNRYTYRLEDLSNLDAVWAGFQEKVRTDVRKAQRRYGLRVRDDLPLARFLELNAKTFARQGLELPYSRKLVARLDRACAERHCRRILFAEDQAGQLHAAIYLVWDQDSAYYLMSGADPELRHSGATSLLLWEAIRLAATVTRCFDFEGSMLEPVERHFRAFGARQVPYLEVRRLDGWLAAVYHTRQALRCLSSGLGQRLRAGWFALRRAS